MKRKGYHLFTVLIAVVMFFMVGVHVQAATGQEVTKDGITAQIITDKDSYTAEETVNAVIRVQNNTESKVSVVSGFNLSSTTLLLAGEESYEATLKPGEQWTTPDGITVSAAALEAPSILSGGVLKVLLWIFIGLLAVCAIVAFVLLSKNKKTKAAMLFLSLTMAGMLAVGVLPAQAASKEGKMDISCRVQVDGEEKEITATIKYTILESQKKDTNRVLHTSTQKESVLTYWEMFRTDFSNDYVGGYPNKGNADIDAWSQCFNDGAYKSHVNVEENGANKYLHIYVDADGAAYNAKATKSFRFEDKESFDIQFKIKTQNTAAGINMVDPTGMETSIWEGQYSNWTDIKLELDLSDPENPTRTTYVNGTKKGEAESIELPDDWTLLTMEFVGKGNILAPGSGIYLDDLKAGCEVWVTDGLILEENHKVNWASVNPSKPLTAESFVNNTKISHPRILVSDWNEILEKINSDPVTEAYYNRVKRAADSYLSSGAPAYTDEAANESDIGLFRKVRAQLVSLAFTYNIEKLKDNKDADVYLNAAYEQMMAVAEYPEWDAFGHYLSTAEVTYGYAYAYDWLYDALTEEQRAKIIEIVKEKSLTDVIFNYEGVATGYTFVTKAENWNPVCNGAILATALAFADEEPVLCEYLLERAPLYLRYCLKTYKPDGAYNEGVSYWDYGTVSLVLAMDALDTGFDEDFELPKEYKHYDSVGIDVTCDYPIYFTGPTGRFNYGDCNTGMSSSSIYYWMSNKYNKPQYTWYQRFAEVEKSAAALTGYEAINAICWYDPEKADGADFALDKFYTMDAEEGKLNGVSMRSSWERYAWDKGALYAAMQGGKNDTSSHMHLSLGTYVIDYKDKRFVRVLDDKDYSLSGSKAAEYYKRAEAYNTLVINPTADQDQYTDGYASVIKTGTSDNTAFGIMDMSKAYFVGFDVNILSAKRGLMMTDNRNRVVVQDEVKLDVESEFYWYANTDADAKIAYDGKSAVLNIDGERMLVRIVEGPEDAVFELIDAKSTIEGVRNSIVGNKKLCIHVMDVKELNLAVEYIGMSVGEGIPAKNAYVPLDEWTADDPDLFADAKWEVTIRNGLAKLSYFDPERFRYSFDFNSDETKIPEIKASGTNGVEASVVQASVIGNYGVTAPDNNNDGVPDDTARVTLKIDGKSYDYDFKMQRNPFEGIITWSDPGVLNDLKVNIEVGELPKNPAYIYVEGLQSCCGWLTYPERGVVDDVIVHLTSVASNPYRWACDCENSWIMMDLGKTTNVHSMAFAGVLQDIRQYLFDVLVSEDGQNWTTVHTGGVPMLKDDYMHIIDLEDNAYNDDMKSALKNVRYVKIEGHKYLNPNGTLGPWDNYTEIRFYNSHEKEKTDISYWPAYFSSGENGSSMFTGMTGEVKGLEIIGVDYYKDSFELRSDAEITYKVEDDTVVNAFMEDGKLKLKFMRNGTTKLTVTATQDGISASTTIPVVCNGVLEGADISTVRFLDANGKELPEFEMKVVTGGKIPLPSGPDIPNYFDLANKKATIFGGWIKFVDGKPVGRLLEADAKAMITKDTAFQSIYSTGDVIFYGDGTDAESLTFSHGARDTVNTSVQDPLNEETENLVYKIEASGTTNNYGFLEFDFDPSTKMIVVEYRTHNAIDNKLRVKGFVGIGKYTNYTGVESSGKWTYVRTILQKDSSGENWIIKPYALDETTQKYTLVEDMCVTYPASGNTLMVGAICRPNMPAYLDDIKIYTLIDGVAPSFDDSNYPVTFADRVGNELRTPEYRILPEEDGTIVLPKAPVERDIVDVKAGTIKTFDSFALWTNDDHDYPVGVTIDATEKDVYQAIYNEQTLKLLHYIDCSTVEGVTFGVPTTGVVMVPTTEYPAANPLADEPDDSVFYVKKNIGGSGNAHIKLPIDETWNNIIVEFDTLAGATAFVNLNNINAGNRMWYTSGSDKWQNVKVVMTKNSDKTKWTTRAYVFDYEKCTYVLKTKKTFDIKENQDICVGATGVRTRTDSNVYFDNIKVYTPIVDTYQVKFQDYLGAEVPSLEKTVVANDRIVMPIGMEKMSGAVNASNNTIAVSTFAGWKLLDGNGNPTNTIASAGSKKKITAEQTWQASYKDGTGILLNYTDGSSIGSFNKAGGSSGTMKFVEEAGNMVIQANANSDLAATSTSTIRLQSVLSLDESTDALSVEFSTKIVDPDNGYIFVYANLDQKKPLWTGTPQEWLNVKLNLTKNADGKWTSVAYTAADGSSTYVLDEKYNSVELDVTDITAINIRAKMKASGQAYFDDAKIYVPPTSIRTVTFLGDDNAVCEQLNILKGESITLPDGPVKEMVGNVTFRFIGWYAANSAGEIIDENTVYQAGSLYDNVTDNLTFKAKYEEKQPVTVTFIDVNGNPIDELNKVVAEGSIITLPTEPLKKDKITDTTITKYSLSWVNTSDSNDVLIPGSDLTVSADVTYQTYYTSEKYSLLNYTDGTGIGTFTKSGISSGTMTYNVADPMNSANAVIKTVGLNTSNSSIRLHADLLGLDDSTKEIFVEFRTMIVNNTENEYIMVYANKDGTKALWLGGEKGKWLNVKIKLTKGSDGKWTSTAYTAADGSNEYVAVDKKIDYELGVTDITMLDIKSGITSSAEAYFDDAKIYIPYVEPSATPEPTPEPTPGPTPEPTPGPTPEPTPETTPDPGVSAYTVSFLDVNGTELTELKQTDVTSITMPGEPTVKPTQGTDTYTFLGWKEADATTNKALADAELITSNTAVTVSKNITYKAIYSKKTLVISCDGDDAVSITSAPSDTGTVTMTTDPKDSTNAVYKIATNNSSSNDIVVMNFDVSNIQGTEEFFVSYRANFRSNRNLSVYMDRIANDNKIYSKTSVADTWETIELNVSKDAQNILIGAGIKIADQSKNTYFDDICIYSITTTD